MAEVPSFAKAFAGRWRIVEMDVWDNDFLDLVAWPAFNLADSFIVVGVAILFGALVLGDRSHRMHGARGGDASLRRR